MLKRQTDKKWAADLNGHFTKEGTQMAHNHLKAQRILSHRLLGRFLYLLLSLTLIIHAVFFTGNFYDSVLEEKEGGHPVYSGLIYSGSVPLCSAFHLNPREPGEGRHYYLEMLDTSSCVVRYEWKRCDFSYILLFIYQQSSCLLITSW